MVMCYPTGVLYSSDIQDVSKYTVHPQKLNLYVTLACLIFGAVSIGLGSEYLEY